MSLRSIETHLARFTLGALVIYVPVETWVSWPYGLWHPFYLVDFFGMVLMFWGAWTSLRARPRPAPALLCAAYGWSACNGWRTTFWRVLAVHDGETLEYGATELWGVAAASAIALVCFGVALVLVVRGER